MYDYIIRNGLVIDGSGATPFCADVAIKDGKIAFVGHIADTDGVAFDATGLAVTPGFIDSHSHSDGTLLRFPGQKEKLEQGITTAVAGQCGTSPAPKKVDGQLRSFGDFFQETSAMALGCNHIAYVGHGAIRRAVMGNVDAEPTAQQMEQMKALLRDAMEHGAIGLSFGLMYNPGCYSKTEELVELAKVVAEYDGVVSSHIRNEGDFVEEALEEFLHILREAKVRGVYSHHKACGKKNHGKVYKTMAMLERAREEGVAVWCDAYPYIASSTSLSASFVDKCYREGTPADMSAALSDPGIREKLIASIHDRFGEDLSWVLVTNCTGAPQYNGYDLGEIAAMRGTSHAEAALDLVRLSPEKNSGCFFSMSHDDMKFVLAHPITMVCTDSGVSTGQKMFHPRLRGSFPRALGRYAREEGIVTLQEMVRKMTSLPASVYRLSGKGLLREGMDADICVFDPEIIRDTAEYMTPSLPNEGLAYVFVGGKLAVRDGAVTGERAGRMLQPVSG